MGVLRMMRKLFLAVAVALGVVSSAKAQFYQSPQGSSTTAYAIMWLSGNFEFHTSSKNATPSLVLSSTGGITCTFGIQVATANITAMLNGVNAAFSGWITASSATYASSMTAQIVNTSSITINGVPYTFPSTDGISGQVLTHGTGGALTWATPAGAATLPMRKYDLYVGTTGAVGADVTVTAASNFTLALASFGAAGLTYASTGTPFTMLFSNGLFDLTGSTLPGIANIVCSASTTLRLSNTAKSILINYGSLGGVNRQPVGPPCLIDTGGQAFASQALVAKGYSYQNVIFVGGQNQAQVAGTLYPQKYSFFNVQNSSQATGDLWFKEFRTPGADSNAGLSSLATWTIDNSANCIFRVHTSSYNQGSTSGGAGQQFLTITGSTMCEVYGNYDQVGTGWINLSRNSIFNHIWGGYMKVAGPGSAMQNVNGDMMVVGLNNSNEGIGASSANVFGPFEVHVVGDISSWNPQVFRAGANGATDKNPWYTEFRDISVYCENPAGNLTGVFLGSDARKTAIINVHTFGCATSVNNGATGTVGDSYLNNVRTTY